VCVHVTGAVVRVGKRPEIVAGPVMQMTSWILPEGTHGLYATPEAVDDLPAFRDDDSFSSAPCPQSAPGSRTAEPLTLHLVA
jgi:hypothetical protein